MSWLEVSDLARQMWVAWLMLVFLGIVFYAFRPRNKRHFEECSNIPFKTEVTRDSRTGELLDHD
jgi:cytochrome c oxidase cbb3-type subunit IV